MIIERPKINDKHVEYLLDKIDAEYEPQILPITPSKDSVNNECFENVENKIKKFGGKMVLGYQIWKNQYFIEAEAHAIWEDKKGFYHDITPKRGDIKSIMFVSDEKMRYLGQQINSIRLNISGNEIVDYLIELYDIYFLITNKGERANQHALLVFTPDESNDLQSIQTFEVELKKMLDNQQQIQSPCFCESKEEFKECHGKVIKILKDKYRA